MNERLAKAEAVFHDALELPADQRETFLQNACGDDAELRHEVVALLRASGVADRWLRETERVEAPPSEVLGTMIGRYKLLEALGEGGCGAVWLAEQREPVRRKVALKIIKLGMDSRQVVARFEAERQALALMDHPNIAKVFDAGTTDTGRPYFVMELVRGIPITKFCDENKLATGERLDLFIKVCQAVQHAHQKGIIHRDLKPSNILITLHDGVPVPKVIDFGIAKATQQELTDKTIHTLFQQFIGTPAYVSPEQAEMSGLDIDTRSDIYSLGVLLYELLTGTTPFHGKELLASGLDEMRRTIREVEPVKPSTRLTQERLATRSATSAKSEIRNPKSEIDKDLDWIVMKCLEKDRTRRYETANGLATDLKRHLSNEPVVARPPSAAYRFQKLVRRNKLAFAATGAVTAALVGGLAIALAALARERSANRLAEQRLMAAVHRVESVLTNDVTKVSGLPGSTPVVEGMLRDTVTFMEALAPARADNPEFLLVSAKIHANLARLQGSRWTVSLGDPEAALASASNAWRLLRSIPMGALPRVRVQAMTFRAEEASGMALEALGREDEAFPHYDRMLTLAPELDQQLPRTGNSRWTSDAHMRLGAHFMIKWKWEQMREHNDHLLRDPYLLTNAASEDLGRLHFTGAALWCRATYYNNSVSNRNVALALDYFRQSLSFSEAYLKRANSDQGAEYGAVLTLVNIGGVLCQQRNYAEGLPKIDEALRRMESLAARDKANWIFQDLLTEILLQHADRRAAAAKAGVFSSAECLSFLEQARTSYERCLERMKAYAANPSRQKSWVGKGADDVKRRLEETVYDLGEAYQDAGRPDSAEAFYREQLAQNGSGLASLGLGRLLLQRAKSDTENPDRAEERTREGERLLREYLATGLEHPDTLWAADYLAISYHDAGRREEALKLREEVLALCRKVLGPQHPDTLRIMHNLALSYSDAGRREEALKLREEVLALRRKVLGPEHRDTLLAMDNLAYAYRLERRFADAEPLYREHLQSQTTRYPATNDIVAGATYALAGLLHDWAWSERGASDKSKAAERAREAERLLRDCLATRAKTLGPESSRLARTRSRLGEALVAIAVIDSTLTAEARLAQFTEAESLLLKAHEALRQHEPAEPKYKRDALERLVRLYEAWDKPEKLSEWQQKLEAFKAGESKYSGPAQEDRP